MTSIIVAPNEDGYTLTAGGIVTPVAVGKNGLVAASEKTEGDGKTPCGTWPVRKLYYRADRITLPASCSLDATVIHDGMGWCDDPEHDAYNQMVQRPFAASHEVMIRDDHAYDVVITLGYNDAPPVPGRGSAIFFHLLHEGKTYTEGCVAIPRDDMLRILPMIDTASDVTINR